MPIQNKKNISQKQEMEDEEWHAFDEALLTQLANVRENVDTTLGKRYTVAFYKNLAARLSIAVGVNITAQDVGKRVRRVREIFQSYETGTSITHPMIENDRYRDLLRRCFFLEYKPIQIPRCLTTSSNIRSQRSTSYRSGSSQSAYQAPTYHVASVESPFSEVLAHLHSQHRERLSPNRLTLFSRYLDNNATAAGAFLRLEGHEQQLYYIENLDLDAYKDPWPRN